MPESVPPQVADVVLAALDPDPGQRPAPAEVADVLAPLLGRLPQGRLSGLTPALSRR
jgi:hypothetical protein